MAGINWSTTWGDYLDDVTDESGVGLNKSSWWGKETDYIQDHAKDFRTSYGQTLATVPEEQRYNYFDKTMDDMAKRIGFGYSGEDVSAGFNKTLGIGTSDTESQKQGLFDYMAGNIGKFGGEDMFADPDFGTFQEAGPFTEAGFGLGDEGGEFDHLFE